MHNCIYPSIYLYFCIYKYTHYDVVTCRYICIATSLSLQSNSTTKECLWSYFTTIDFASSLGAPSKPTHGFPIRRLSIRIPPGIFRCLLSLAGPTPCGECALPRLEGSQWLLASETMWQKFSMDATHKLKTQSLGPRLRGLSSQLFPQLWIVFGKPALTIELRSNLLSWLYASHKPRRLRTSQHYLKPWLIGSTNIATIFFDIYVYLFLII